MSERIISTLIPALQPIVREVLWHARAAGLDPFVPDDGGARSAAVQTALYARGRRRDLLGRWQYADPTTHAGVVTNALPRDAPHCRGAAVDVLLREHGKVLTCARDLPPAELARQIREYAKLGELYEAQGLEWGGRWEKLRDFAHGQLREWREYPIVP